MRVLVVNAGSSSVKLRLLDGDDALLAERDLDAPHARVDPGALQSTLADGLDRADAVGHRIVHGGERFRDAVQVDDAVLEQLDDLTGLAPLHQPKSLAALRAVSDTLPGLPAVACFDTAFHATLPAAAATYALPRGWRERWGVRRYGFHGLSHAWIARRVGELLGERGRPLRIVSCHLGAGASLCAISGGRSIDTTMGFTPLEGLVMATRSGSVDPGLLLWLLEREALSERELAAALEHRAGLLGLAGSPDMPEVQARAARGDPDARLAIEVYLHRLRAGIAAMAASLGGLDAVAFTGGVGEHDAAIRAGAARGLEFLGLAVDEERNQLAGTDRDVGGEGADREISREGAAVRSFVILAREDREIAGQVRRLLGADPA